MAFESDDYRKMKREYLRLAELKRFIDLACEFEKMRYSGDLTVSTSDGRTPFTLCVPVSITIDNSLKSLLIDAAIGWCVDHAMVIADEKRETFDIEACIKV